MQTILSGSGYHGFIVVVVQLLSRVQLFASPWTAARQVSLSFTVSQSLHKLVSIESILPDLIAEDLRSQRCNTSKGPGAGESTVISDSMSCSPRLFCPWDSPGKITGEGHHSLL